MTTTQDDAIFERAMALIAKARAFGATEREAQAAIAIAAVTLNTIPAMVERTVRREGDLDAARLVEVVGFVLREYLTDPAYAAELPAAPSPSAAEEK